MPVQDPKSNLLQSTVATAPSPATSGTSLVVAGGTWPVPSTDGAFNALIFPAAADPTLANSEIVRVTVNASGTFTMTRAQEGTTARTVVVGDRIMLIDSARTFTDIEKWLGFGHDPVPLGWANSQVLMGLDSGLSDFYGNGTVAHDSTVKRMGTGSYKLTCATGGGLTGGHAAITTTDLSQSHFGVWLRSDDWAHVNDVSMLFSSSGSAYTSYYQILLKANLTTPANNEWRFFTFTRSNFTVGGGTPNWAAINQILVRAASTGAFTPIVWLDSIIAYPQHREGIISIGFDDSFDSQYSTAKPIMDKYNFRGTIFHIPDQTGQSGRLTETMLQELHEQGWDIAGHGDTNLTTFTTRQLQEDLDKTKQFLGSRGFRGQETYAYPNGAYTTAVINEVLKRFTSGRGIDGLRQTASFVDFPKVNCLIVSNTTTTAAILTAVDEAIANGEWLNLCFHEIITTATIATHYSTANFTTVVDGIASRGATVKPYSEVIELTSDINALPWVPAKTQNTATQGAGFSTDTYLTDSAIKLVRRPGKLTKYVLTFAVSKTAAGTATPIINIRIGTGKATTDTSRATLTFGAGTAAIDTGVFTVEAWFRTVGSGTSAVLVAIGGVACGTGIVGSTLIKGAQNVGGGFDSDATVGQFIGASYNAGTSAAHTIQLLKAELVM